jgi:hypothetical protein
VLDDVDMRCMNVFVCVYKVRRQDRGEKFRRCDWVLLCEDVGGLFLGVGGYDDGVIGFRITMSAVLADCLRWTYGSP